MDDGRARELPHRVIHHTNATPGTTATIKGEGEEGSLSAGPLLKTASLSHRAGLPTLPGEFLSPGGYVHRT